eukprot:1153896-Alexandrium_andersonii.AAC.1
MGDQDRHPVPQPPAPPEAPYAHRGAPVPECGLGTHSDSRVFWNMSPVCQGRPGASAQEHRDRSRPAPATQPVGHRGSDGIRG